MNNSHDTILHNNSSNGAKFCTLSNFVVNSYSDISIRKLMKLRFSSLSTTEISRQRRVCRVLIRWY